MEIIRPSLLGRTVIYIGPKGETVVAIVTKVFTDRRVNLALIKDGTNQAHLADHAYTIDYAPVDPTGGVEPNTWHCCA